VQFEIIDPQLGDPGSSPGRGGCQFFCVHFNIYITQGICEKMNYMCVN